MRHLRSIGLLAALSALSLTGCVSLDDSPFHTQLGMATYELDPLIDWNWPSAQNQGPLQGPQRLRPDQAALGTTWGSSTPPWLQQSPTLEAPSTSESHTPPPTADDSSPPAGASSEAEAQSVDVSVGAVARAPVLAERR